MFIKPHNTPFSLVERFFFFYPHLTDKELTFSKATKGEKKQNTP